MGHMKLAALDEEDLAVLSAHLQDAVIRVADMAYRPQDKRFAFMADRLGADSLFCREGLGASNDPDSRRRTGVHFDRVLKVATRGIDRSKPNEMLELIAIQFIPGEPPMGYIDLMFAGGKDIRLTVECVEAELRCFGPLAEPRASAPEHA